MKSEWLGCLEESERLSAVQALADDTRSETVSLLVRALNDKSWRVRQASVSSLVRRGGANTMGAVLGAMRDDPLNLAVLNGAIQVLTQAGVDTMSELTGFVTNPDVELRIAASLTLGAQGSVLAVPTLMDALADPDPNVRYHAIEALGKLRAGEAVDALAAVAESGDFSLAFPALDALALIGDARVAYRLIPLLDDEFLRTAAVETLGQLGDEETVAPLAKLLNTADVPVGGVARALAALHDRYETSYRKGGFIASLVRKAVVPMGVQNLIDALDEANDSELQAVALVLSWMEGTALERALTRVLGRPAARDEVVEALVKKGPRVTALLIEQLTADDLETRQAAVLALGRIGDVRAVPALLHVLAADEELMAGAAGALAMTGDRRAYAPLLSLIGHANITIRRAVVSALNSIGHPDMAADAAVLLRDPRPLVRESAVKIVGYAGFPSCVDLLLECCRDEHLGVRRAAVEAVPCLEDARVLEVLAVALQDETPEVRAAATRSLGQIDAPDAWPLLQKAVEDGDPWVRYFATRSMGRQRQTQALDVLARLAQTDPAMQVRVAAVEALGRLGAASVLAVLESLADADDEDLATAVLTALGATRRAEAVPPLLRALSSSDPRRRMAALRALGQSGRVEAVDALRQAAVDADASVATAAIDALGGVAAPQAVDALLALTALPARRDACLAGLVRLGKGHPDWLTRGLDHPHLDVRRAVVEALARLKDPRAAEGLSKALEDPEGAVRLAAITALAHSDSWQEEPKLAALAGTDPDLAVRRAAQARLRG